MNYVIRINLKTDALDRKKLVDFCLLNKERQYVAIGWSYVYKMDKYIPDYKSYYYAVKDNVDRINHAHNVFWDVVEGSLFWTRDLEGNYWICRAKGSAQSYCDFDLDIGAVVPVEAYKVGLEVPGQIKASFNRPRGGTVENIYDEIIVEYSKFIFNKVSGRDEYQYKNLTGDILDNLPDLDLEELVIIYLQVAKDYYVLSNSIANKSTTIKIECELISRTDKEFKKAVVQVKGGKTKTLDALDYKSYVEDGYLVYLYAPEILNIDHVSNCIVIEKSDLNSFFKENHSILPESITKWECLFE